MFLELPQSTCAHSGQVGHRPPQVCPQGLAQQEKALEGGRHLACLGSCGQRKLWQRWGSGPGPHRQRKPWGGLRPRTHGQKWSWLGETQAQVGGGLRLRTNTVRRDLGSEVLRPRTHVVGRGLGIGGIQGQHPSSSSGSEEAGENLATFPSNPQNPQNSSLSSLIPLPWVGPSEWEPLPSPSPSSGVLVLSHLHFSSPLPSHILPDHMGIPPIPLGVWGPPPISSRFTSCEEVQTLCPPTLPSSKSHMSLSFF